jgi:hypothetical protein
MTQTSRGRAITFWHSLLAPAKSHCSAQSFVKSVQSVVFFFLDANYRLGVGVATGVDAGSAGVGAGVDAGCSGVGVATGVLSVVGEGEGVGLAFLVLAFDLAWWWEEPVAAPPAFSSVLPVFFSPLPTVRSVACVPCLTVWPVALAACSTVWPVFVAAFSTVLPVFSTGP